MGATNAHAQNMFYHVLFSYQHVCKATLMMMAKAIETYFTRLLVLLHKFK
jgi:hypothetical protein